MSTTRAAYRQPPAAPCGGCENTRTFLPSPLPERHGGRGRRKLATMSVSHSRRFATTVLTGAAFGAALLCISPLAHANEDPSKNPPNCSSADLQGIQVGVEASTSAYLFTHPDLNTFMSGLGGLTRSQVADHVKVYMADHPQEKAEMAGIRQPLQDLKNRCGVMPNP
jgi:hemophore-related protein